MKYRLLILRRAQKELADLPKSVYERAKLAIQGLEDTPRPRGSKKLTGREGWRLRVGEYRVIYELDDVKKSVTVLHVGHRRDVYH